MFVGVRQLDVARTESVAIKRLGRLRRTALPGRRPHVRQFTVLVASNVMDSGLVPGGRELPEADGDHRQDRKQPCGRGGARQPAFVT